MNKDKDTNKRKSTLLQALSSQDSIEMVVDDWISRYNGNNKLGILDLVQLLSDAAGHDKKFSIQMMEKENVKEMIDSMTTTIVGDTVPPVMNKRIKVRIAIFFQRMIQKCNSLLFDNNLLDAFFSFLVPMSRHSMRAFRFVGTFVGVKVMTALVNVLKVLTEQCAIVQQQLSAEQTKDTNSQSSDRIELLQVQSAELQRNEEELNHILHDYLIKIIFKQRILDKMPEIQVFCLSEAVTWMQICPDIFMVDKYLLYYKVLMPSASANVRETILKSLLLLYETKSVNTNLKSFTKKCLESFIHMTLDTSIYVSVVALNLLTEIIKTDGWNVLDECKESIFHLVFSKHKQVATGAGTFLLTWLNAQMNERPTHISILISLVEFFEEASLPLHAPFMVEALFHKCPAMTDWEAMSLILIRECRDMTAGQETCFLKIMTAAMKQACNGISPRTQDSKPTMTTKAMKLRESHKLKITECFTEHLPRLLHKYRDDAEKVVMFLHVVKHLKLERIIPVKEGILNSLLKSMENLIEIHSDEQVLRGCCDVMEFINSELHSTAEFANSVWDSVEGNLFGKFMQTVDVIQKCFQGNILPNDDQKFILCNTLEKIVIFYEYKSQKWEELWGVCLNHVSHSREHLQFPVSFIINCIKICHLNVLWARKRLDTISEEELTEGVEIPLQSKLLQLLYVLQQLMTHEVLELRESAYFVICDILLIFCEDCMPSVKNLGISADETLHSLLQKYIERTVFLDDYVEKPKEGVTLKLRQSILMAYCKLASYGMLEIQTCIWLFKYYEKKGKDYDGILKKTFTNMLESDAIDCGKALMNILISSFTFLKNEKRSAQSIKKILKDQCGAFSHLLAASPHALIPFHQQGILFAFGKDVGTESKKIFLEVLMDFVETLTLSQSRVLLEHVKRLEGDSHDKSNLSTTYQNAVLRKTKSVTPQKKGEPSCNSSKPRSKASPRALKRPNSMNLEESVSKMALEVPSAAKRKVSASITPVNFRKNTVKSEFS